MASNVTVRFLADVEGLRKGVDQVNSKMSTLGNAMKAIGIVTAGAFAAKPIIDFARDAVQAGSDLQESMSKVEVVFGDASGAVVKWAEDSATAFGQSKQQALEAAGTFGNLLQAFGAGQAEAQKMSTSMVQLAADLASFNNTSVEDALTALRSGLSGETEPLKRYGVALNDVRLKAVAMEKGLYSGKGTLDVYAKSMAAYELIMQDTALAQGDFARTSDGLANQQRILGAAFTNLQTSLGTGIIKGFGDLSKSGGDLAQSMEDLGPVLEDIGEQIGMVAGDMLFLTGQIANLTKDISNLIPSFGDASENASDFDQAIAGLTGVFFQTGGSLGFFAGALRALQNGPLKSVTDSMDGTGVAARNTGGAFKVLGKQVTDVGAAAPTTADRLIELANDALASGRAALQAGKGWAGFYEAAMQAEADYRNNLVSGTVTSALVEGIGKGPDPDAIRRMSAFNAELDRLHSGLEDITGGGGGGGGSVQKLAADWKAYADALTAASDATITVTGKQLEITEKQGAAIENRLNKASAAIAFQQGVIDSSKAKLEEYDRYVQSIVSKVTGGLNPDDFVTEVDGTWIFDALGFEAAIKDKAKITEAVAGIAGQIPEAWAQSILGLPTDKANAVISWFANNPATDSTILTEYNALTQKVTDVWGPQLAEAYTGINKDATIAGIEQAKQTIEDEAEAFKKWVRKKLKTRIVVEVEYKEVNQPPAAAASNAVAAVQQFEALNGRSWRV